MSAFSQDFLFLVNPRGGVEDLSAMKAASFQGVFCNVRDFPPSEWESVILPRARALGMFCGPWGRTQDPGGGFSFNVMSLIISTADRWGSPLVLNCEKEINGFSAAQTGQIAQAVGTRDAAIITEPWLYNSTDWHPLARYPVLLEIFPADSATAKQPAACKEHAHDMGFPCVYFTYGTYGGQTPSLYDLRSPYSLYTGDAMGGSFQPWKPTGSGFNCQDPRPTPPVNGGIVPLPPIKKKEFRTQLERYLLVAEKYRYRWHYSQARPFSGYHLAPSASHYADCSGFIGLAFYAAGVWAHAPVADPLNEHYSGYGNTWTMAWLKAHHAPLDKYRIGDIALYEQGPSWHHHTTVCVEAGTAVSAWFMSNGQEADPRKTKLHYRSDLTGVYRHPALL